LVYLTGKKQIFFNPLSAKWRACTTTRSYTMSESETTSESNWKVIGTGKPEGETRAHIKSLSLWTYISSNLFEYLRT